MQRHLKAAADGAVKVSRQHIRLGLKLSCATISLHRCVLVDEYCAIYHIVLSTDSESRCPRSLY